MLIYKGVRRHGQWLYSCKHLKKIGGRWTCTIQEIKPDLCKNYPFYGRKPSEKKIWLPPSCGFREKRDGRRVDSGKARKAKSGR
jgi:Fe-S-cluster containining protein